MPTKEEFDLLTAVGPGTAMGHLFRQYWLPLLMSSELPEQDGAPKRMRMLGEDLIAFRDTSGRVGLLGDHCAHRGASLFFGRNEEDGLRCVYHGWKYDVEGSCVDMPNEPPESNFKHKVRQTAYPCRELNGTIWTYMGPREVPPLLPELEWTRVPDGHFAIGKTLRECSWLQALEGDIDNAHVPFLHSQLDISDLQERTHQIMYSKKQIHLEVVGTPYGAMYGARRDADEEHYNWRIIHFMFPSFSMITTGERGVVPSHMWIPIDDHNTMQWGVRWNPTEPIAHRPQSHPGDYHPNTNHALSQWRPVADKTNDYLIDRQVQRTQSFSGVASIPLQDKMATESMGPITDRTKEHLGTTDAMIIRVRLKLIEAAKALRDRGEAPPCVDSPDLYGVRSAIVNLPKDVEWVDATREVVKAFTGLPAASLV